MSSVLLSAGDKAEPFEKTITAASVLQAVFVNDLLEPVKLVDLGICNYHTATVLITVEIFRTTGSLSFKRYSGYSLLTKTTLAPDWAALLYDGDEIRVSADVANVVDVTGLVVQAFGR